jgi:hypothetical protein
LFASSKHSANKLSMNKPVQYNMPPVVIGGYGQHSIAGTLRPNPHSTELF